MVNRYFRRGPDVTLCELAGWAFTQPCCTAYISNPCNQDYYLGRTLTHLGFAVRITPGLSEPQMIRCLSVDRTPVGLRLEGYSGGHYVLVRGYENGAAGLELLILDPQYGVGHAPYPALSAIWTHCYETS
jgi:hypothetical protein